MLAKELSSLQIQIQIQRQATDTNALLKPKQDDDDSRHAPRSRNSRAQVREHKTLANREKGAKKQKAKRVQHKKRTKIHNCWAFAHG